MKAWIISLREAWESRNKLLDSHETVGNEFDLNSFDAFRPEEVKRYMEVAGLVWTYPWNKSITCPWTGLKLHPYKTRNPEARMACFMSHYLLWHRCAKGNEPYLILEDDALFIEKLPKDFNRGDFGVVGINDPRGATRLAGYYHEQVQSFSNHIIITPPWVDADPLVPQGLPGNSAYIISPTLASLLCDKAREIGCWPNDALMCRQLFPWLGVSTTYYTKVQGRPSTLA